jgi:hypothetical protein
MPLDLASSFGCCCDALRDAMEALHSNFRIEKEVLFVVVVGGQPTAGFVDQAVFYCPFCGKQLQTAESVRAKLLAD